MIRIRDILDTELQARVTAALAERRGLSVASVPDWYELDEMDLVDLLDDFREQDHPENSEWHDARA
jgi:hypothetical protein